MWLCVGVLQLPPARAQELTAEATLHELRSAVELAQFERAAVQARALLARDGLRASERNDALELLAIAQIAARDEAGAQATLRELFIRDPNHSPRLRDPGPQVEVAFARAHAEPRPSTSVPVSTSALRDPHGRTLIEVQLGEGRGAVESVDVFAQAEGEAAPMHLVADPVASARISLPLPALHPRVLAAAAPMLSLYVEARAPSGYVLGRDGTHEAPLRLRLEPELEPPRAPGKRWWLWTSVAIVVAGVAVGGAIAAH
jgi:hypothetical protein